MSGAGSGGALICGFSDLAAGIGGLAWQLGEPGGLVLDDAGVHPAEVELSRDAEGLELRLSSPAGEAQARLAPRTGRRALETASGSEPPGGRLEAAVCTAEVSVGARRNLRCFGHLSSWDQDPSNGAGAFRHLAIERPDGSLLLVTTRGETGTEHGDEETASWLLDSEGGFSAFGEALLSTQYDSEGRATRAGLELWPAGEEAPPMRAAGTRLGGSDGGGLTASLLSCSTEGNRGLGSYLIRRA